ncbi:Uncharacterised protein [Mycobacteroides abscessus subsp. abscessus]|uniref:hypothetical protein n=1 Tax=Mycobacteroides abscessus TaxID=36809 RepID=UPI0009B0A7A3|nr:hypothetical protein [Mycobacteroides abscessus]SLL30052.1 Uncharacterised protein [Mycobacteroides abscessus subsp. abscessus]
MAGKITADAAILSAEQTVQMWSLHGLPGHIGGAIPEYADDDGAGELLGWVPICSCSWNLGAYLIVDNSDPDSQRKVFTRMIGDWLGHLTIHLTADVVYDALFPGNLDSTAVWARIRDGMEMVITRPRVTKSLDWSG